MATYKDIRSTLYGLNLHDVWVDPNLESLQYYHRHLFGLQSILVRVSNHD